MDQAQRLHDKRNHRRSRRRPRSLVNPLVPCMEASVEFEDNASLGAFLGKRRPYAHIQTIVETDPGQSEVDGVPLIRPQSTDGGVIFAFTVTSASVSQGCLPTSLYAP